jgi:predicted nucleic acid-binding protein
VNRDRLARRLGRYLVHYADDGQCERLADTTSQARVKERPIEIASACVAATDVRLGIPLATNNPSDYAGVDGLTVLAGTAP